MVELQGKTVLITGSAAGIGAATAAQFARRGCNVTVNYSRSAAEAQAVAEECRKCGGKAIVVQADVASDADCRRLVQSALDAFGGLDILVNNAGITRFVDFADMEALTEEVWNQLFRVNVYGTFFCTRAAAPTLKKSGKGAIINIASTAGLFGTGSSIAYAASKAAVVNMTKALARTLAPEIRVNAVAPGPVDTRWLIRGLGQAGYRALTESVNQTSPLRKVSTPEDVAEVIVWLAEGADNITGEIIKVDGGIHLGQSPIPRK